ncbi:MAG: exodeoxyribonuclease V subunit gamma [Clostridia bacterium]|nr:exodeoxyribonuclease V subunit gamma [Clostridia bacterium]
MIYLVEGRSGFGKTRYVSDVLHELAKKGEKKLMYIIPEQSSFECETLFLRKMGPKLSNTVSVMSFTRLYDMVMRQTGYLHAAAIDDGVRKVLMSLSLEECADRLDVYAKQAMKPQMTDLMLTAVKEFKMCGISTDTLRKTAKKTIGTDLSKKLEEVSLVTDVYNAFIAQSYVDPLDNNARLEKRLGEVKFFEGYTVVVDDFSGFTAQEQRILDLIMAQSKDFYITLCREPGEDEERFFTVNRTRKRILDSAARLGLRVASPVKLFDNHRTESDEIGLVEREIYRLSKAQDTDSADIEGGSSEDVTIGIASDIFEECEYVAEQISELALGGECRYRDIAVVCRNTEKYTGIIDAVFESRGIPYFMSKPEPIDNKPLMRLVLSAFEYVLNPSDSEKLFQLAKCGLLGVDGYEIALLENYAYIWGIDGRKFFEPFTSNPDGYTDREAPDSEERLFAINNAREKIMIPLGSFSEKIKNQNAFVISKAVYELLADYGVNEALLTELEKDEIDEYSNEEIRLWELLTDILNKMYLSLGERYVSVKRYYELLKMMICSHEISDIPQTLDQVTVASASSVRLRDPYAVFVIGANHGEFPHDPVAGGVFNDIERRSLISLEVPVYDAVAELYLQEKFLVYNAVSAPKAKLYVTYPTGELGGGKLRPSSIVSELQRIIPNVKTEVLSALDDFERIQSDKEAFESFAKHCRKKDALSKALKAYLKEKPEFEALVDAVEKNTKKTEMTLADKSLPPLLFGRDKNLSASQIENYYMCRFKYFCNYGLKLRERRKAQLGAIEYGSLIHYLLENVVKQYQKNGWERLCDDELEQLLDELLKDYISEFLGGEDDKSDRFVFLYYRLKKSTQALMNHLSDELSQSEFKPIDFELSVGFGKDGIPAYTVLDDNGNLVRVSGFIDRVDIMQTEKADYIRIVDYKTGKKEFRLSDVLYGLNMQMLIYLSAIAQNGEKRYGGNIHPSGVLYMPSTVSSVNVKPFSSEEEIKNEHDKNLRMNGIVLDESQVIFGMEEKAEGKYIPVSLDKNGKIKSTCRNYVISKAQLDMIFDKVEEKIKEMSQGLDNGDISAVPTSNESMDACLWCGFNAVCGHAENDMVNCLKKFDKEQVVEILENEKNGKEEN